MADQIERLNSFGVVDESEQKLNQLEGVIAAVGEGANNLSPHMVAAALQAAESIVQDLRKLNRRAHQLLPREMDR